MPCKISIYSDIWIFHKHIELVLMTILASEDLLSINKKSSNKMLPGCILNLGPQPSRANALFCFYTLQSWTQIIKLANRAWPYEDLGSAK